LALDGRPLHRQHTLWITWLWQVAAVVALDIMQVVEEQADT